MKSTVVRLLVSTALVAGLSAPALAQSAAADGTGDKKLSADATARDD